MALNIKVPTKKKSQSLDLTDTATRSAIAKQLGVEEPKEQPTFIEKLGSMLSSFETGNATYETLKTGNLGKGIETYFKDIVDGISTFVTGNINKKKKTYSDVLKYAGVEDKTVRSVVGFLGDVLLDPSTYVTVGAGAGAKVGGKTLTTTGKKVAANAGTDAVNQITKIAGKSLKEITDKELPDILTKFAADNGIKVSGALGVHNTAEIINQFKKMRLDKMATSTGAKLFEDSSIRFMGKSIIPLSDKTSGIAKAVIDPVSMTMENAAKVPFIKSGLEKTKGVFSSLKGTIGKVFDPNYSAKVAGMGNLGEEVYLFKNLINNIQSKTGMHRDQIIERLGAEGFDVVNLPYLMEEIDPKLMQSLLPFYSKEDILINDSMSKLFKDVPKGAEKQLKRFATYISNGNIDKAKVIIGEMSESGVNKELVKSAQRILKNSESFGGKFIKQGDRIIPNDMSGLDVLVKDVQSGLFGGKNYVEVQKAFDNLGLEGVKAKTFFPRDAVAVMKDGKFIAFDEKMLPITAKVDKLDPKIFLGKDRTFDTMLEGNTKGELLYSIQEALTDGTGGRIKWETLTRDKQKEVWESLGKEKQKQIINATADKVAERNARQSALVALSDFTNYVRDSAKTDLGDRIALDITKLGKEEIENLKLQGYAESTIKSLKGYMIPKEADELLKGTIKAFTTDEGTNEMLKIFDKAMSLWKTSVTTWFPAFHVRNGMSNVFINTMEGVTNPQKYVDAKKVQDYMNLLAKPNVSKSDLLKAGNEMIGDYYVKDILELAEKNKVIGLGGFYTEVSNALDKSRPGIVKRFNPLSKDFALTKAGSVVGNFVEDNAKLTLFIDRLTKGDAIEDAARTVRKALFDYSNLTVFEKNVFRRLVPFYSWTRFNAEYMARFIVANPGKFGVILKGFRDVQDSFSDISDSDWANLPSWVRQGFSVVLDRNNKDVSAITSFGTPIEAFGDFMDSFFTPEKRTALNFLGPVPRGIIEQGTGISLFTGKEISKDIDGKKFRDLPSFLKDAIGYREIERTAKSGEKYTEYVVDSNAKWILNLFLGRITGDLSKLLNAVKDPSLVKIVDFMSGIKSYEFNLTEEETKRQKEAAKKLYDLLIQKGEAKEYTQQYLTKEAKEKL